MYTLSIIAPVVALGAMGLFFGLLLAVSSKIFHVEQDERLPQITEVLPGANCGGCGYPGCSGFASAVVAGEALQRLRCGRTGNGCQNRRHHGCGSRSTGPESGPCELPRRPQCQAEV